VKYYSVIKLFVFFQIIHYLMYSARGLLGEIPVLSILEKLEYQKKVFEVGTVGISNDK